MSLVRRPNVFAAPVVRRFLADDLFDGFERLFDDVSRGDAQGLAMDFYENEDALVLELAVPGVTASGVDVRGPSAAAAPAGRTPGRRA